MIGANPRLVRVIAPRAGKRVKFPPWLRRKLMARYGHRCYWCGVAVFSYGPPVPGAPHPHDLATIDHITPLWRGGLNLEPNLVVACYRCNGRRNDEDNPNPRKRTRAS